MERGRGVQRGGEGRGRQRGQLGGEVSHRQRGGQVSLLHGRDRDEGGGGRGGASRQVAQRLSAGGAVIVVTSATVAATAAAAAVATASTASGQSANRAAYLLPRHHRRRVVKHGPAEAPRGHGRAAGRVWHQCQGAAVRPQAEAQLQAIRGAHGGVEVGELDQGVQGVSRPPVVVDGGAGSAANGQVVDGSSTAGIWRGGAGWGGMGRAGWDGMCVCGLGP